jgi:hypothetical protein
MKNLIVLSSLALVLVAGSAMAQSPETVVNVAKACCDVAMECCKALMDCCAK